MSHAIYRMNDLQSTTTQFELLYVTHSSYDKGWHSTPHTHHFTELFYIVSGKGSFLLLNKEIPVKQNDLVVINPNVEHTEKSNEHDPLEYIAIGIQGIAFTLPQDNDLPIGLLTYQGEREEILFFLKKLILEVQQNNPLHEIICRNIIEILIVKLKREKKVNLENHKAKNLNQSVAIVKNYIKQNYQYTLTLDDLSEIGNINKYYLAHKFKAEVGVSPIEYLNQIRIDEAKILLESTDLSVAAISQLTGFSSQSLFSQSFKRSTNLTPSKYRNKTKQKLAGI